MKDVKEKVTAEMRLPRFALKTNGLSETEMHLRVQGLMELTDSYTMLGLLDEMLDEVGRNGVRALGANTLELTKRQVLLRLDGLRRWFVNSYCNSWTENCDRISDLQRRVKALEAEHDAMNARLTDGWTERVTFDSMVEQIAACEDPRERDEARKLIEPMLKRDTARRFRDAIKRKVQETQGEKAVTFNNYGTFNEVHAGGININNQ